MELRDWAPLIGVIVGLGIGTLVFRKYWRLCLLVSIIIILCLTFFNLLREDPNFATAMLAFATVGLAFFAAWSIDETRRKEKRDRKERWLKEIGDWAEEGFGYFSTCRRDTTQQIIRDNRVQLAPIEAKNTAIIYLAKTFDEKFQRLVKEAATNLDIYFYFFEPASKKPKALAVKSSERNIELLPTECKDSFIKVLKAVANLRTKEKP